MENKPEVLYVQMGHVVAIGDIVALLEFTVTLVVRASVGLEKNLHHLHSLQYSHIIVLVVGVVMLAVSSACLFLTNCLNIETIHDLEVMDSSFHA